jgi:photosystem II stability/assembly factor-like uncharacterized protein
MNKGNFLTILVLLGLCFLSYGQRIGIPLTRETQIIPTKANERLSKVAVRKSLESGSLTAPLSLKNIGPTVMSGRVVDIDVDPADPTHFFVAFASGGLWVTHNNGQSFTPIFDQEAAMTIGDFAVDWNNNETIWIGTGEVNSSRSSYSGLGIFIGAKKSEGGMESWTWTHNGLEESHHIGRVVLHPQNKLIAWVAVLGHLYSLDENRGIYKTMDGGKSWKRVLYVSNNTGAVDLVIDPINPQELYAATWQRTRSAWNFEGQGKGSGVYKTTDGGDTWSLISHVKMPGSDHDPSLFNLTPSGFIGRIGLALHHSDQGKFLYAMLDNQNRRPETKEDQEKKPDLLKADFKSMRSEDFLALNDSILDLFLRQNNFDDNITATSAKAMVRKKEIAPSAFYDYLYDANEDLFNTPVVGAEIYLYHESSASWERTHEDYLDDLVFTYGYYFGVIHVSSHDPKKFYVGGVPLLKSNDGGKSFTGINPDNVHVDHHVVWENPQKPGHIINGSDGGIQISYDDGVNFVNCNSIPVGQFYAVQVDNRAPYHVYGGLQDNGVWTAPHDAEINESWKITGQNPYREIMSGDGMQIMVDQNTPDLIYTGYQFGNYQRINLATGESHKIQVNHKLGERPLRWNWQTPILLSSFNNDIFYICSNKVHRSTDGGMSFETLSGDLTRGEKAGNVPFATITSISESPIRFGLLAVGSDDGLAHISKDNGYSWENISNGLPSGFWVSRIIHSVHKLGRMYVALNGYRNDYFKAMLFVSEDWGKSWKSLSDGLPMEPVNVVKEDPANDALLYVGTDHGLYCSIDRGANWMLLSDDLPSVAVHDLAIQQRERDLLIGTHGRSLWIADIEQIGLLPTIKDSALFLFDLPVVKRGYDWGGNWSKWLEPDIPEIKVVFYSKEQHNNARIEVRFGEEMLLAQLNLTDVKRGLNVINFVPAVTKEIAEQLESGMNLKKAADAMPVKVKKADDGKYYLPRGNFEVELHCAGHEKLKTTLTIK